jgi:hypothetical protein
MQDLGVKVIPYTNARMMDTNTHDWKMNLAE